MSVITAAELNTTTCPPWCSIDHTREPADHHASGEIELSGDVGLFLFNMPGEGVTAKLWGPDGEVDLKITDIAKLGQVFTKLTAALAAVAFSREG